MGGSPLNQIFSAIDSIKGKLSTPISRFAPSPTGYLHLGHLTHMIYVWGITRAAKGQIILRMEDHDRGRCRLEYEESIFKDLKWLGFEWDNRSFDLGSGPSPFRQSDCLDLYTHHLEALARNGLTFNCSCSRKEIQHLMDKSSSNHSEQFYFGTCREQVKANTKDTGVRLKLTKRSFDFEDLLLGAQTQLPASQCGDMLIQDRLDNFTYQYAVCVDDLRHQVNLIIRGQDLTNSTGRQLQLRSFLGDDSIPMFLHHPLIKDDAGNKLSKRALSESLSNRRENGESAESLLGLAGWIMGITLSNAPISIAELLAFFKEDT